MPYDSEDAYSDDSRSSSSSSSSKSSRKDKIGSAITSGLSRISSTESDAADRASSNIHAVQYKRGGRVRKTGPAILHKNERVIPAGKRKKVERLMKRSKMRMKARR